jgi:hypothetical protein
MNVIVIGRLFLFPEYSMQFGFVSLDRENQIHTPKPSLAFLGSYTKK